MLCRSLTCEAGIIGRYSILLLDDQDMVVGSKVCDAVTDGAALAAARSWLGAARAIEVWQGPRLVGRLPPEDPSTPPGKAADEL